MSRISEKVHKFIKLAFLYIHFSSCTMILLAGVDIIRMREISKLSGPIMEGEQAIGYGLGAVISSCVYMKSIFLKRFPAEYRRMLFYRWIGFFIIDHAVKFVLVFVLFKAGMLEQIPAWFSFIFQLFTLFVVIPWLTFLPVRKLSIFLPDP